MNSDWTKRKYTFSRLREWAEDFDYMDSCFSWLKVLGIVPENVESVKPSQVKMELDPQGIDAGYLASVAFEWDSWGPSSPVDLINALRCELKGSPERDIVSGVLTMLGKAVAREETDGLALSAA